MSLGTTYVEAMTCRIIYFKSQILLLFRYKMTYYKSPRVYYLQCKYFIAGYKVIDQEHVDAKDAWGIDIKSKKGKTNIKSCA